MKTIFRAVFYLRSNYVNKEGKTPVMLRIYLNNERLSIGSTGIAVQQSQWDSEKERLRGRTTEVLSTNLELDNIQSGLQTIFKKLEMTDAISLELLLSGKPFCYFCFLGQNFNNMGKSTHFIGQPVYNEVIKLLDKQQIKQISLETPRSEAYVKRLDGWTHLVIMLFGILKHFDSLREVEIGMKADVNKLHHLGIDYVVRRSTLADANKCRPQEFFAKVYAYLLGRYGPFLADSRPKGEQKTWEKLLYMMDSTTITLFDNILKGVGRHPKSGKKKGGMKVHTVMKYHVGVPMVVQLTSAAKYDHYLLKEVHLPKDATLTMDRAYGDYAQFHRLTEEGVCYMTKMKKNLTYKEVSSNPQNDKLIIMVERANVPPKELDLFH